MSDTKHETTVEPEQFDEKSARESHKLSRKIYNRYFEAVNYTAGELELREIPEWSELSSFEKELKRRGSPSYQGGQGRLSLYPSLTARAGELLKAGEIDQIEEVEDAPIEWFLPEEDFSGFTVNPETPEVSDVAITRLSPREIRSFINVRNGEKVSLSAIRDRLSSQQDEGYLVVTYGSSRRIIQALVYPARVDDKF